MEGEDNDTEKPHVIFALKFPGGFGVCGFVFFFFW